jgi:hypothetical protein
MLMILTLSGKDTKRWRPDGWKDRERGFSSYTFVIYRLFFYK